MSRLAVLLAVTVLTGCGGGQSGHATLWVTRDRGAHVLVQRQVPAGLTAMQALDRVTHITTRYSGRYVQSINGIEGSLNARQDWFYFINGYEADRSAAEYRLRNGDVEWWDFRSWRNQLREPVVVGAFPEPFLHGYGGRRLPARVVYKLDAQRPAAERLAKLIGARATRGGAGASSPSVNVLLLLPGKTSSLRAGGGETPGDPVVFTFRGNPDLLLRKIPIGRFRYQVGP